MITTGTPDQLVAAAFACGLSVTFAPLVRARTAGTVLLTIKRGEGLLLSGRSLTLADACVEGLHFIEKFGSAE